MEQPKFVIEATDAESMAQSLGLPSVRHLLPALVQPAQSLARPAISNFHVAAVGLGSDGRVFVGVNLEFPGLPLNQSVHAEQFLVTNLLSHRCPRLIAFAVSAAPCGHCRQFFQELRHASSLQLLITSQPENSGDVNFKPLSQFIPNHFGPDDLLGDETPLLLDPRHNGLTLTLTGESLNGFSERDRDSNSEADQQNLNDGNSNNSLHDATVLETAALEAANESHAPYTQCPSGTALMDCEGKVYRGSYTESAAYNPSLGPIQAALVAFVAGGGGGYERIVAAVLVEKRDAQIKQEDSAKLMLKVVSPKCEFKVVHVSSDANLFKKASS
ncbi:unnamed protein product [Cuscuta europaea]|uniref:cytidine deaminase n=1 Tax=Cuscuta europaea TaxID=41803 RepID=A0A9P0YL78_CUSEU|nr:unnamed protein product [Cuscuta europaea]